MHGNAGIMLDLETLATEPGAGVIEVGYCVFSYKILQTNNQLRETGHFHTISLEDNLRHKMLISKETLDWWEYDQGGLPKFSKRTMQATLAAVAEELNYFWKGGIRDVWAKPSLFDVPILQHAMDAVGIERPLCLRKENFRHWQCFATLRRTVEMIAPEFRSRHEFRKEATHNALSDAVDQAAQANVILAVLPEWRDSHFKHDTTRHTLYADQKNREELLKELGKLRQQHKRLLKQRKKQKRVRL